MGPICWAACTKSNSVNSRSAARYSRQPISCARRRRWRHAYCGWRDRWAWWLLERLQTCSSSRGRPESTRGDLRSLDHGCQLGPGDVRGNRERAGEGGEATVGSGDDALPTHHGGIALDALGDKFGMLDEIRGRVQDARNDG